MDKVNNKTENQERLQIINYGGYFKDVNGILKGEWGGFNDYYGIGPHREIIYGIYYNLFSCMIPINEFGYFYGKFSCKKYDAVLKFPIGNLYLCEKNGRFGVITENEKYILHATYKKITPYIMDINSTQEKRFLSLLENVHYDDLQKAYKDNNYFFIITTETGKFFFDMLNNITSDVYDNIILSSINKYPNKYIPQIYYRIGDNYGILNMEGKELLKPYYIYKEFKLYYRYQNRLFNVWTENEFFYGLIPISDYDICFMVGSFPGRFESKKDAFFFIIKKGEKYGLLSSNMYLISEPFLDEIIFKPERLYHEYLYFQIGEDFSNIPVIAKIKNKFRLYNVQNGHLILDDCDYIKFSYFKYEYLYHGKDTDYIEYEKGGIKGYVLWNERIINTAEYEKIETKKCFFYVKKNNKWGVIKLSGEDLFSCIYDNIKLISEGIFILEIDGKEEKVNIYPKRKSNFHSSYERPTYDRYSGSYAQDEMGYSDDDIDTIFDGDPSAYWNID